MVKKGQKLGGDLLPPLSPKSTLSYFPVPFPWPSHSWKNAVNGFCKNLPVSLINAGLSLPREVPDPKSILFAMILFFLHTFRRVLTGLEHAVQDFFLTFLGSRQSRPSFSRLQSFSLSHLSFTFSSNTVDIIFIYIQWLFIITYSSNNWYHFHRTIAWRSAGRVALLSRALILFLSRTCEPQYPI